MTNDIEKYKAQNAAREAWQQRKEDRDEQARRESLPFWKHPDRIVRYTGYLAIYTAILTFATFALVATTVVTAMILRSTDEATHISAGASRDAVNAALAANRPHILMENPQLNNFRAGAPDLMYPFSIAFKNYGQSPGFVIKMAVEGIVAKSLPETPAFPSAHPNDFIIAPNVSLHLPIQSIRLKILEESRQNVLTAKETFFTYGFIEYRDVFNRPHKSGFAYRLVLDPNGADYFSTSGPSIYWEYN